MATAIVRISKTVLAVMLLALIAVSGHTATGVMPTSDLIVKKTPWADVRAYGAKGNWTTNDTAAIQAALNSGAKTVLIPSGTYKITAGLNVPAGVSVVGEGINTSILKAGGNIAINNPETAGMLKLNGYNLIEGLQLHGNCTFSTGSRPYVINNDGAEAGILIRGSSHNTVRNNYIRYMDTVGIYVMAYGDSGETAKYNIVENNIVENHDFVYAGEGVLGLGILVRARYSGDDAELGGAFLTYNYDHVYKVAHNKIIGNTVSGGALGLQVNNGAHNTFIGNDVFNVQGSGMELELKALHNTVTGNTFHDNGNTHLSIAFGSHNNVVTGNSFKGTHGATNYALAILYGCNGNIVSNNSFDSRFDIYAGTESRAPSSGILISQYVKDAVIQGNTIKGYRYAVRLQTTMYTPAPTDPEYYLTGFQNVLVKGNIVQGAYALAADAAPRLAMPQNDLYGIYLYKNTTYDKSDQANVIAWAGLIADGNIVDGVEYPYIIKEETATASPALRFTDVVFQNNKALNCSSGTGIANYPIYVNVQLDKYIGINNSWNFLRSAGDPALTSLTLWGHGELVTNTTVTTNPATGEAYEYRMTPTGTWAKKGRGAAAPTTHTWSVGDIVSNSTPSVGQPKGWRCTVGGTSGTWVSEGNL